MQSPFKFLDCFTKEDRDIFFGRERETEELYQKIFESKILLVYGVSGTGKSSLIQCGLGNKFNDSDWLPISIRRESNINESLFNAVTGKQSSVIGGESENTDYRSPQAKPITDNPKQLKLKDLRSLYLDHFKPIYLIFDQFEELFIFGNQPEKEEFVQTVKKITESDLNVKFLFVIREEYLANITEFERQIPGILENRIRIEKMNRKNAVQCIEGPCRVHGIEVEQGFSENLLNKLSPGSNKVELTYLQVFLDKIYRSVIAQSSLRGGTTKQSTDKDIILNEVKQSADDKIASEQALAMTFRNELLTKLGDVKDLLGSFLEEQITTLDDPDTALAILKSFVSIKGTKRQNTDDEVIEHCKTIGKNINVETFKTQIAYFVNIRILRDKDENGRYELRHDALAAKIYEKITLVEKELMEIRQFIENAYENYVKRNILLSRQDLGYIAPYENKLILKEQIQSFIAKSKHEIGKARRRRQIIYTSSAIILLLIFAGFTWWALNAKKNAEDELYNSIRSSLTISTDNILILYLGVNNNISISVSGVDKSKLLVDVSNASIEGDSGSYIVRPITKNNIILNVKGITNLGDTIDFGSKTFRVKLIPDPITTVANKSGGVITKGRLLGCNSVDIQITNFVFDLNFKLISYTFLAIDEMGKTLYQIKSDNNKISENIKSAIKSLNRGNIVIFKDIIIQGPDGSNRRMKSISFEIVTDVSKLSSIEDVEMLLQEFEIENNWDSYYLVATNNETLFRFDEIILNSISENILLHINDKQKLEKAVNWSKNAILLQSNEPVYYETWLKLLIKLNAVKNIEDFEQKIEDLGNNFNNEFLVILYNNLSLDLLYDSKYKFALELAIKGSEIDSTNKSINTKLALAYLLNSDFNKCEKVIKIYQDSLLNDATFGDYILDKLEQFEKNGITHPDFIKVRALLNDSPR